MHLTTTTTHLEVLSDLADETLEGELPDKELRGLLVPPDLTESDRSGPETVGLLHTAGGGLGVSDKQDTTTWQSGRGRRERGGVPAAHIS